MIAMKPIRILLPLLALLLPASAQEDPLAEARAAIAARDGDRDGRLDAKELGAGDAIFKLLDRNRDGYLDPRELAPPPRPEPRDGPGGWGMGPGPEGREEGPGHGARDGEGRHRPDDGSGRGRHLFERIREMDADGDGNITKAEWKGPEELFARLDRNADGTVAREEIAEIAERMGGWRGKAGDTLLRRADKDQDGRISREEWPLPAEQFDRFDADRDGFVSAEEMLPQGPRRGRKEERKGREGAEFLAKHDLDKDGKLSREEFTDARRFAEMDANQDGVLDAAEVEDSFEKRSTERGYGFFEVYDLDRDGKVTREEFTGPARIFEREDRNRDGVIDAQDRPAK